jgi:tetratricopeptide (TPR) repeat protein
MPEQDFSEIAKLSERFSKDPKSRIFVQLADAYRKNNMVDEALAVLDQGLTYHPQYPLAYLILGKCYFDKRMYAQSREALEKTIAFDPMNIVALRLLAQIGEATKDEDCQLSAYKGIVTVDPTDATAREKLAALEAHQRKGPVYTLTLAEEYEKQGNLPDALKVYEHLGFTDPSDILIQQRIKEIKSKLSGDEKKEEEQKLKELKLEQYFEADQLSKEAKAPGEVQKPDSGVFVESIHETMTGDTTPVKPAEPSAVEPLLVDVPKPTPEPPAVPGSPPEEVLSLQDFLVDAEEKPEAVEEKKPAEPLKKEKEAVALFSEPPIFKQPPAPAEPAKEPVPPEEKVEILSVDEFLHGTGKTEPPAPEPVIEPEPPAVKEPPPVKVKEEVMAVEDLLVQPSQPEAPLPGPVPAVEEAVTLEPEPAATVEPLSGEPQVARTVEPEPPAQEEALTAEPAPGDVEKPIAETEPGKTEAEQKPKEEDFKSFQDWLSSLLK